MEMDGESFESLQTGDPYNELPKSIGFY